MKIIKDIIAILGVSLLIIFSALGAYQAYTLTVIEKKIKHEIAESEDIEIESIIWNPEHASTGFEKIYSVTTVNNSYIVRMDGSGSYAYHKIN